MNAVHVASGAVLVLLGVGLLQRRRRPPLHRWLMLTAFMADLSLVLYIEATRHAVERVVTGAPRPLVWVHAGISLAVLACYPVLIGLGRRLIAGAAAVRPAHRRLGLIFCVLRTLNYVTSLLLN